MRSVLTGALLRSARIVVFAGGIVFVKYATLSSPAAFGLVVSTFPATGDGWGLERARWARATSLSQSRHRCSASALLCQIQISPFVRISLSVMPGNLSHAFQRSKARSWAGVFRAHAGTAIGDRRMMATSRAERTIRHRAGIDALTVTARH